MGNRRRLLREQLALCALLLCLSLLLPLSRVSAEPEDPCSDKLTCDDCLGVSFRRCAWCHVGAGEGEGEEVVIDGTGDGGTNSSAKGKIVGTCHPAWNLSALLASTSIDTDEDGEADAEIPPALFCSALVRSISICPILPVDTEEPVPGVDPASWDWSTTSDSKWADLSLASVVLLAIASLGGYMLISSSWVARPVTGRKSRAAAAAAFFGYAASGFAGAPTIGGRVVNVDVSKSPRLRLLLFLLLVLTFVFLVTALCVDTYSTLDLTESGQEALRALGNRPDETLEAGAVGMFGINPIIPGDHEGTLAYSCIHLTFHDAKACTVISAAGGLMLVYTILSVVLSLLLFMGGTIATASARREKTPDGRYKPPPTFSPYLFSLSRGLTLSLTCSLLMWALGGHVSLQTGVWLPQGAGTWSLGLSWRLLCAGWFLSLPMLWLFWHVVEYAPVRDPDLELAMAMGARMKLPELLSAKGKEDAAGEGKKTRSRKIARKPVRATEPDPQPEYEPEQQYADADANADAYEYAPQQEEYEEGNPFDFEPAVELDPPSGFAAPAAVSPFSPSLNDSQGRWTDHGVDLSEEDQAEAQLQVVDIAETAHNPRTRAR